MAAQINLKVTSNFDQAAKDIKQFGTVTEAQAEKIKKFQESFKSERVDQFIDRQNRARAAVTATRGPLEALKQEQTAYRREIERLIKAGLDPQDEALKKLRDRYNQLETEIEQANDAQKKSNGSFSIGIKSFTDLAVAGKVAIEGLKAVYRVAVDLENAFFEQEKSVSLLNAALRASGQFTEETSSEMQRFASELQSITTVGDEVSIGLMQIATSAGLTSDQAQQATKDAIGLSKAFGVSLESAIKATTNAQQGNYDLLNRYIPSVKNATDETQKQAVAEQALAEAFQVATAEAETASGTQIQLNNAIGDGKEILGAYVSEYLTPFRKELLKVVMGLNAAATARRALNAAEEGTGSATDAIAALNAQKEILIDRYGEEDREVQRRVRNIDRQIAGLQEEADAEAAAARQRELSAAYSGYAAARRQDANDATERGIEVVRALTDAEDANTESTQSNTEATTEQQEATEALLSTGQNLIGEALVPMTEASREMWQTYGEGIAAANASTQEIIPLIDTLKENFDVLKESGMAVWSSIQSTSDAYFTAQLSNYDKDSKEYKKLQKEQFIVNKATSAVNAGIAGAEAAIQAYKALAGIPIIGPGLGAAAAAAVGALTATQVGFILAQKPPTFQTGTMPSGFTVPESSSTRGDSIGFMAQPGETINVTPRGEGSGQMITVNVVMNDQVLETQVQSLLDSNRLTFTNDNLRSA